MGTVKSFLFISICLAWFTVEALAQPREKTAWFGFYAIAALPVGGFADVSPANSGCGNTGFGGELYAVHELRNNTKLFSSLNININTPKKDVLISKLGTSNFKTTQYITTNLILGPTTKVATIFKTDIMPFGQAGVQMLATPKTIISTGNASVTRGPDVGFCFTYALGCMFNMPHGNIAVRYIKGQHEITEHYQLPGQDEKNLGSVNIGTSMIQVMVGVTF